MESDGSVYDDVYTEIGSSATDFYFDRYSDEEDAYCSDYSCGSEDSDSPEHWRYPFEPVTPDGRFYRFCKNIFPDIQKNFKIHWMTIPEQEENVVSILWDNQDAYELYNSLYVSGMRTKNEPCFEAIIYHAIWYARDLVLHGVGMADPDSPEYHKFPFDEDDTDTEAPILTPLESLQYMYERRGGRIFRQSFKCSHSTFLEIVEMVEDTGMVKSTAFVPVCVRVAVTLYKLGSKGGGLGPGFYFNMSDDTAHKSFLQVTNALCSLKDKFSKMPGKKDPIYKLFEKIAPEWEQSGDNTHIPVN